MDIETRRALVELLLLAPYLDQHLSCIEDETLERALTSIGWSASRRGDVSLTDAFALVREAAESEIKTEEFMQQRAAIIRSAGEATVAYEWLAKILASDGLDVSEIRFLQRANILLFD